MKKIKKRNRTEAYIKGLHTRIKGLQDDLYYEKTSKDGIRSQHEEERQKIKGHLIVNWVPHERIQETVNSFGLSTLNPNDCIAIIGRVKEVKSWIDGDCDNKHSQITYEVTETRKLD